MRVFFSCLISLITLQGLPGLAQSQQFNVICGSKQLCSQMNSCAEAKLYLDDCRAHSLDRDNDGTPCESICGDGSLNAFLPETAPEPAPPPSTQSFGGGALIPQGAENFTALQRNGRFSCARRKTCGAMISCEEAFYHLLICSNGRLDGDGMGHPCERLCGDERGRIADAGAACKQQGLRLNAFTGVCQSR